MSIISELNKTKDYLRSSRNAILARGGEISPTAGLKDLPNAIYNIPADSSLAFPSDDTVAYRKIVPVGAEQMARVETLGGMTYKCNNLAKIRGWSTNSVNFNNSPLEVANSFGTTISTTEAVDSITVTQSNAEYTSNPQSYYNGYFCIAFANRLIDGQQYRLSFDVKLNSNPLNVNHFIVFSNGTGQNASIPPDTSIFPSVGETKRISAVFTYTVREAEPEANYIEIRNSGASLTISNVMITDEAITDTTYEPYFEGLRSAKVTSLKSEGANLIPFPYYDTTKTINGITFTVNSDGSITANGTATANTTFRIVNGWADFNLPKGENYISGVPDGGAWNTYRINIAFKDADGTTLADVLVTANGSQLSISENATKMYCVINVFSGVSLNNIIFRPMLNYGSTPAPFTPYRAEPIDTLAIPEWVQSLPDWGEGLETGENNHIKFAEKKYRQEVERVVFNGTENWNSAYSGENTFYLFELSQNAYNNKTGLCNLYNFDSVGSITTVQGWFIEADAFPNNRLRVRPDLTLYPNVASWKAHLAELYANGNPLTLVYALAEPIETDISAYLTSDGFFKVQGGGTVVAENEYEYAVPSKINYVQKVGI